MLRSQNVNNKKDISKLASGNIRSSQAIPKETKKEEEEVKEYKNNTALFKDVAQLPTEEVKEWMEEWVKDMEDEDCSDED